MPDGAIFVSRDAQIALSVQCVRYGYRRKMGKVKILWCIIMHYALGSGNLFLWVFESGGVRWKLLTRDDYEGLYDDGAGSFLHFQFMHYLKAHVSGLAWDWQSMFGVRDCKRSRG